MKTLATGVVAVGLSIAALLVTGGPANAAPIRTLPMPSVVSPAVDVEGCEGVAQTPTKQGSYIHGSASNTCIGNEFTSNKVCAYLIGTTTKSDMVEYSLNAPTCKTLNGQGAVGTESLTACSNSSIKSEGLKYLQTVGYAVVVANGVTKTSGFHYSGYAAVSSIC